MKSGFGSECWATVAGDTEEVVKSLVLAKSLRRHMTSRSLVLIASHQLPNDIWGLAQQEFDVVVRLDSKWMEVEGLGFHTFAKMSLWSLEKWAKIVFLHPDSLVVRNCDEIFKERNGTVSSDWNGTFLLKPSVGIWRTLEDAVFVNGVTKEYELFSGIFGTSDIQLEARFGVNVDMQNGLLAKNLRDLLIVKFVGMHPMEVVGKDEISSIPGSTEGRLVEMWKNHLEHGVAQKLSKLENINCNGLKGYMEHYRGSPLNRSEVQQSLTHCQDAIAIVGMSCRFPGANTLDEFWELLIQGGDAIGHAPEGRWTLERCPILPEESKNSKGGFLSCSVDEFDGKFFGVSPMELSYMDPQQRLTLQVAWEALEDAGIDPLSLQNTYTGVFGGSWRTDYREALQTAGAGESEFLRCYLGNTVGVITARISHCLGLTGPSVSTESGCSSSIVAVDLAVKSLLRGETDLSLAAGVNLIIHPFTGQAMDTVLSEDAHCKTFDAKADGFARAEGCGVLILKRYPDAVRDGDRVWGLIRGSAVVQEGASRSLGTPTVHCEALAMKLALEQAGVEAREVSYVETHGTGTPVGDPLEVAAVARVYSEGRVDPLIIGSVKTNIGHTESCSGIAGIIKVALSMQHEMIPPHRNFQSLNPLIDLDAIPATIPLEAMEWKRDPTGQTQRLAGVSSFGITGTDAHVIVQETPRINHPRLFSPQDTGEDAIPWHILTLSGKTKEALEDNLKQFRHFLEKNTEQLKDIAYTTNVGRGHFLHRAAIVAKDKTGMLEKMKNTLKVTPKEDGAPKLCFLFTGQGSQYPGMAKSLYNTNQTFKMHFDQCSMVLEKDYKINIKETLWGSSSSTVNLSRTIYSQTSIFCVEYCLLKLWESWGIKPDFVLGHSLGEFAAAVGAGILGFEDALKLVAERSRLIDALPGGKMIVLKESKEKTDILLKTAFEGTKRWLDYAAVNSPEQTVVAGDEENVQCFGEFCRNNQIKTHILDSTHAFHSRHMDPILKEYERVAKTVKYSKPTTSVVYVSGMDGRIIEDEEEGHVNNPDYWVRHTRDSVRFSAASKAIMSRGCTMFLEVGPQPVLSALTMINSDGVEGLETGVQCLPSLRKQEEDWECILSTLGKLYVNGVAVDWKQFYQFSPGKKITVPFYPFQNKPYWFDIPDRGPGEIHPLVGSIMSNASNVKLYQNSLTLENAQYLKDHRIGSKIVFPGAGFVEMCLVAGHAATQCTERNYSAPTTPLSLENFVIESPLCLNETEITDSTELTQLQSVVSTEESGETKVSLYSKLVLDKDTQKWIKHASATFSPFAIQSKEERELLANTLTLDQIRERCNQQNQDTQISETYAKLADFGLVFGETFRTLRNLWTGSEEVLFEVNVTDNPEKYICHPVVTDALFQAVMIAAHPEASGLHVPVSVNKFISYSRIQTEKCFIHVQIDEQITATLFDSNGQLLAQMVGALLLETTIGTIMSALEAQKLALPTMYQDVWRQPLSGPYERRADALKVFSQTVFDPKFEQDLKSKYNPLTDHDQLFNLKSNELYSMYMIKGLYNLGLSLKLGSLLNVKDLIDKYRVLPALEGFLVYILHEMIIEGYLEVTDGQRASLTFKVIRPFPALEEVASRIPLLYGEAHPLSPNEVDYVSSTGTRLAKMLTGQESALGYLFPEDPSAGVSAEAYYLDARMSQRMWILSHDLFTEFLKNTPVLLEERKESIRILEVGAGTGSSTKMFLKHLTGNPANYEYTYTDLSPVFFAKGEKVFGDSKIKVHYRILNIEEDIASQGFLPHHYDLILANNVIHATKSIAATTRNLRNLLRDNAELLIFESVKPVRSTNLTFGCLDAYWSYKDYDLRGHNCEIDEGRWKSVLNKQGFRNAVTYPSFDHTFAVMLGQAKPGVEYLPFPSILQVKKGKAWALFANDGEESTSLLKQLKGLGNQVVVIKKGKTYSKLNEFEYQIRGEVEGDMVKVVRTMTTEHLSLEGVVYMWTLDYTLSSDVAPAIQPYLNLCKSIISLDHPKLFVVTRGVLSIGDQEVSPPTTSPVYGMTMCFKNEQPQAIARCIDLDNTDDTDTMTQVESKELLAELLTDDEEIFVAYRNNQRLVPRIQPWKPQNTALSFPPTTTGPSGGRFRLLLPASNAISDLRFGPVTSTPVLTDGQVEARVKAYALNFRDVFAVLKPTSQFEQMNTVGIDWSGVVTAVGPNSNRYKIGDAIFGCNLNGDALPSHAVVSEDVSAHVPDWMTFYEAATLPAVASTAFMCLIQVAQLKREDTILIHTGSGGVGLVAIQIAQSIGARIVTTGGSKRKRSYLRGLGIEHVFHSRNTNYEGDIRTALGGGGVDVVLNSLTSPGFKEASLSVCNPGARFIEMSKLNTWTPEQVKEMRPDVDYRIVDLSSSSEAEMRKHLENVSELISGHVVKPIPYCRFDASEVREALGYMQKAKHIGKIVLAMPESESQAGGPSGQIELFNDRSTYLITGGLGGIGIEVAKWMTQVGAKHVALVGRSLPNEAARDEIRRINSRGGKVFTLQYDVGNLKQCEELLAKLKSEELGLPPLRGIMHAAGVLTDSIFSNQSWEKYERTYNPKVSGGLNLHNLTLSYPLEHFVMFSSALSNMGSVGQGNHASANVFLDSLAHYRHYRGLPATTINWGQWGQVGVAANVEVIGVRPFTALQGISALEKVMKSQRLQTCVFEADFSSMKQLFNGIKRYIEELETKDSEHIKELVITSEQFWNDFDSSTDDSGRLEVVKRFVRSVIKGILKFGKDEGMGDDENFQDLGMDSLMMIEMKNVLQSSVGKRATITVNSVKDCHTVNQLSSKLVQLLSGDSGDQEVPVPTREELCQLIKEDSTLPEHLRPAPIPPCFPSEIKNVLITGVTGNMGPYFLKELLTYKQIEKVICLLRENPSVKGEVRLEKKLCQKGLLESVDMSKVQVVIGSITKPKLGLSPELYSELALSVDAVLHLAVKSDFTTEYKKIDKGESDIRTVNVKGTLEVLDFVCSQKTKLLLHASSIVANAKITEEATLTECWPEEQEFDEMPNSAYPISKFVCDRLMSEGVQERGLPIKVFRFPAVGGDSLSGANVDYENNQLMLRMMSYLSLGMMPALLLPFFILPVDICTSLALKIWLNDDCDNDVYNVYNPNTANETELVKIGEELGYKIEIVEPDDFIERMESKQDSKLIHFLKELIGNKEAQQRLQSPAIVQAWARNPKGAFLSNKLQKIIPGYPQEIESTLEVIRRDLRYAKRNGVFEKFGI